MKTFSLNIKVLLIAFLAISLFTFVSFIGTMANDEGNSAGSFLFVRMFSILRFPTHTLMWSLFQTSGWYFWGLVINTIFYAFLIERIYTLFIRQKK